MIHNAELCFARLEQFRTINSRIEHERTFTLDDGCKKIDFFQFLREPIAIIHNAELCFAGLEQFRTKNS